MTFSPSAADTLTTFFKDTNTTPTDYDCILTGDLGAVGASIMRDMMKQNGYDLGDIYNDCGLLIFDNKQQDTHAGGSGCGCSGSVLTGYVLQSLKTQKYKNVLFMSTGALMSPTAVMQGESIPGVSHLVNIRSDIK